MESEARYVWVGATLIALFLLLAASLYWLTGAGSRPLAKRYVVVFKAQSLDGVQTGTEVRMRGVKVGRVADYGIPTGSSGTVRVILEVDTRVPVLEGARAVVNRNLLTGLARVSIANSNEQAPPLLRVPPGEDYPMIAEGTADLDRVAGLIEDLGATSQVTLQRVNNLLSDRNQQAISRTLENTEALTGQLAETVPELRATLRETRQAAASLAGAGRAAEATLTHADRQIDSLATRATQTLDQARVTLERSQGEVSTLGTQLRLSAELAGQEIHAAAQAMRQAARDVQQPARALADPERLLFGPNAAALGPGEK